MPPKEQSSARMGRWGDAPAIGRGGCGSDGHSLEVSLSIAAPSRSPQAFSCRDKVSHPRRQQRYFVVLARRALAKPG